MGDAHMTDVMLKDGLTDAILHDELMGITAENICERWGLAERKSWTILLQNPARRLLPLLSRSLQRRDRAGGDPAEKGDRSFSIQMNIRRTA